MKIVVAMNAFKGSLTAQEATSLVASGLSHGYREATVIEMPLADGGDGTAGVLTAALGGTMIPVTVTGPYGSPVVAEVGLADLGKTAIIESAKASGLALVPEAQRDVRKAQSRGVGELMLWAAERGCNRIIVGIGGTAMNDGGIGAVQAAGGIALDGKGCQVVSGLAGLFEVSSVALGAISEKFKGIEVIAACDVANPMTGPDGATNVYGPQKGLSPDEVISVDRQMAAYAGILARDLGRDPSLVRGSGAGGGLGAALWAFFGARVESGAEIIMEEIGFGAEIDDADLVVTGEGMVDFQTAKGKVPYAVARAASAKGVHTVVIGGGLGESIVDGYPPEFSALFSSTLRPMHVSEAIAKARDNLRFSAEQIGRLVRASSLCYPVSTDESAGGVVIRRMDDEASSCNLAHAGASGPEGATAAGIGQKTAIRGPSDGSEKADNWQAGRLEVLMIQDRYGFWCLPKGHMDPGETPEQAAVREMHEETGIRARIRQDLGVTRYRFPGESGPVQKTVRFYLMEPIDGELKPQAGEVLDAKWVNVQGIGGLKTYNDTRMLIERAAAIYDRLRKTTRDPA